jgi:single-strand DNA-binding protein
MDLNKCLIVGRVAQPAELRMTPSNQSVASISVATNRTWTDKDGNKQESVQFHSIVLWGRTAEIANQFLQKGSPVLIEGHLETRQWTDKQNVTHYKTEIVCENMQLGQRPTQAGKPASESILPPKTKAPAAKKPERRESWTGARRDDMADGERSMKPLFGEGEIKPEEIPF